MDIPYVVSGDIRNLLGRWAEAAGFTVPSDDFINELRDQFNVQMREIFPSYEFLSERDLEREFQYLAGHSGLPVVSLEAAYLHTPHHLDCARTVDVEGVERCLGSRSGCPLCGQVQLLAEQGLRDIVLADDVIFAGRQINIVVDLLSQHNIRVVEVCAAIGVGNGVERLMSQGLAVRCARTYDKVIDQVCERDFYPGVPHSGRILAQDHRYAVHYLHPHLSNWASIPPEHSSRVSRLCCERSACLFSAMEKACERPVYNSDLPQLFHGYSEERRVVSILRSLC